MRQAKSEEVQRAVENFTRPATGAATGAATGGSLVFVTLTLRHGLDDPLNLTLNAALKAWQRLLQGKSWQKFKQRYGIKGYIRAIEITLSGENGWHPHIHALFFIDRPLTDVELEAWQSEMFSRWAEYVTKYGAKLPTKLRGIDVRAADRDGKVVAQYLAKLQDTHSGPPAKRNKIGQELTRFDTKSGRKGSMTPFELLDESAGEDEFDDAARARLWWEYYNATKGRRAITWSRGLRELVLPDEEEKTDDEILDDAEREPLVMLIGAQEYRQRLQNQPVIMAAVLDAVERGNLGTALGLSGGYIARVDLETGEAVPDDSASSA